MPVRYKVLAYLFSLSVIVYLDRVCISLVAGDMKKELGISNDLWGWVLSAFALSYALFELPTGALGDRFGPRRILTRVVLWWSVFTALTGTAFSWFHLIVIRFMFGIGEAGAYPNASIVVSRWFPKQETGSAQAFIWAAGRLGGAIAPFLVLGIASMYGWRASFYFLGFLGIIWAAAWYWWFRDFPETHAQVTPEEQTLIETHRRFRAQDHHIPWKRVFRSRNMWALMLMFHCYMYGAYFFSGWLPTYLQEGRHFSKSEMQLFAMLPFFLGAFGCFTGGFLSDWLSKKYGLRTGRRSVGMFGMCISSIIVLAAALTADNATAAILLAIGMGFKDLTLPVAFAVCVDIGKSKSGTVAGAMNLAGQLGAVFIGVLFGYIVQGTGNFNTPLFLIAALLMVSGLLWMVIDPEREMEF